MKLRWSKFWWDDFLGDTRKLTLVQTGAWIKILCLMARNDPPGECSADPNYLARELGGQARTWRSMVASLADPNCVNSRDTSGIEAGRKQDASCFYPVSILVYVRDRNLLVSRRMKREAETLLRDRKRKQAETQKEFQWNSAGNSGVDAIIRQEEDGIASGIPSSLQEGEEEKRGHLEQTLRASWPAPPLAHLPTQIRPATLELLAKRLQEHPTLLDDLRALVHPPAHWLGSDRSWMTPDSLLGEEERFQKLLRGGYRHEPTDDERVREAIRRRDAETLAYQRELRARADPETAAAHLAKIRDRLQTKAPASTEAAKEATRIDEEGHAAGPAPRNEHGASQGPSRRSQEIDKMVQKLTRQKSQEGT